MSVARLPVGDISRDPRSSRQAVPPVLGFSDEDKAGTIQPHDDALVVTLRIGGYDVKRVMVDQGWAVEIMYPDLYKGLNLKLDDLTPYCSPLVSFEGRMVTPKGQIRLPVQIGSEVVEVDFIVVDVFSPYTILQPEKEELIDFLKRNIDVFAWSTYKAPGVDPEFICHHLRVNALCVPKKQPPRRPFKEHADAVKEEVMKLKQAGAIKKIPLAPDDQEKTAFVTPIGNYHYKVMPFSLKNASSTYQWMMTKMFESQLGKSVEVYIDDMVVKSKVISEHVKDLDNVFETLRRHNLLLNASKCSFGVGSGKFLGYMVTHRGIEVNPDQIKAIQNLQPPRNSKEVQKLTGMAVALNRFISRSADRCKPFFSLINKWKGFEWTEECASAFQQLKDYLARPPIMSSPEPDEVLFAYIAVVPHVGVYVDGAVNRKGSGVGLVLISPEKIIIKKSLRLDFGATNNEAEYEALLMGMSIVRRMGGKAVELFSDSRLVVGQVQGEFEAKDERMQGYLNRVKRLQLEFEFFSLLHVPRSSNAHTDSLATLATSSEQNLPRVILIEDFHKPTGTGGDAVRVHQIRDSLCWMDPITKFLKDDILLEERGEADKIQRKATRFWLSEDRKLYKRSYSGPYLLCIHTETAELLLEELHEGICGSHTGGRSLAHRAITQGKYLLVGTDYFTKWVEAEPLANIRDVDVQRFVWKNIITHFGFPHTLISDNGLQFDSNAFWSYCSELRITNRYSTPAYPQGNGQAEAVNKVIVNGLKKRLDDAKGKWVEELPRVLWAYRTTPHKSTGETPFSMTYGAEAIIPLETGFPTLKTSLFSPTSNDKLLEAGLDLIEERRENAMVRLAHYQQKLRRGYDANVKLRPLEPGDLVLQKVVGTAKNPTWGKLGLNWEGSYRITSGAGIGAYFLEDLDSHVIPRPWNVNNLKRYYY
ncbi:uncharacterized protein LOC136067903 [Quercus suber]|uniref:uncharacterized protein LOC136067903 n=1 Tax=Quercus suber TaxID=58331 RepID=UPI0032DE6CAB